MHIYTGFYVLLFQLALYIIMPRNPRTNTNKSKSRSVRNVTGQARRQRRRMYYEQCRLRPTRLFQCQQAPHLNDDPNHHLPNPDRPDNNAVQDVLHGDFDLNHLPQNNVLPHNPDHHPDQDMFDDDFDLPYMSQEAANNVPGHGNAGDLHIAVLPVHVPPVQDNPVHVPADDLHNVHVPADDLHNHVPPVQHNAPDVIPHNPVQVPADFRLDDPQFIQLRDSFVDGLHNISRHVCQQCSEATFVTEPNADELCSLCRRDADRAFKFSNDNNMDPGPSVPQLSALTPIEQMLIAQVNPTMCIYRLPRGGQYGFKGHVLNLPQDVQGFVTDLPRRVQDLNILVLKQARANPDLPPSFFAVNRQRVMDALQYLVRNNRYYRNINIVQQNIQDLPVNGIIQLPDANYRDDNPAENNEPHDLQNNEIPNHNVPNNNGNQPNQLQHNNQLQNIGNLPLLDPNHNVENNPQEQPHPRQRPPVPQTFIPVNLPAPAERQAIDQAVRNNNFINWPQRINEPINEFHEAGYIAKAFPALFPTGAADYNCGRRVRVTLLDYFRHLLKYQDRRFEADPRFVFMAYNTHLRHQSLQTGQMYAPRHPNDDPLTAADIQQMNDQDRAALAHRVLRFGHNIRGTSQYWYNQQQNLISMVQQLGCASVFFTFSAADLNWPDLHAHLGNNFQSTALAVAHSPYSVDSYLTLRFQVFFEKFLKPYLNLSDYWFRFEWQHRGSLHVHGLAWLPDAPDAQQADPQTIKNYWNQYVSSWNPAMQPVDDPEHFFWHVQQHPCNVPYANIQNLPRDLQDLVNLVQKHTQCSVNYCLRTDANGVQRCRFGFPKPRQAETTVTINHDENNRRQSIVITPATNDPRVNKYNPYCLLTWRANMDFTIFFDNTDVSKYIAKYASKAEKATHDYSAILNNLVVAEVRDDAPMSRVAKSLLMKTVGNMDMSAQQACHVLSDNPLVKSSRHFHSLYVDGQHFFDPIPQRNDNRRADINKYMLRPNTHEAYSYRQLLTTYSLVLSNEGVVRLRRRPNNAAIIRVFPKYSDRHDGAQFHLYAMQYLILNKPFRQWNELTQGFDSAIAAYEAFIRDHPPDPHVNDIEQHIGQAVEDLANEPPPPPPQRVIDQWMGLVNADVEEQEVPLPLPHQPDFDWLAHSLPHLHLIPHARTFLQEAKAADNPQPQANVPLQQLHPLNEQQLEIIQYVSRHFHNAHNEPIRVMVLGTAGTGKSYVIERIKNLLNDACVSVAPTGVAALNISSTTIHSFFRFGKVSTMQPLRGPALQALQQQCAPVKYMIFDEISMIGSDLMNAIDSRMRQAFPAHADVVFGGCSVIFFGDFGQLPPVGDRKLFHQGCPKPTTVQGQAAYRHINRVFVLHQAVRQAEDAPFRNLLLRLRNGNSSYEDYAMLTDRFSGVIDENVPPFQHATRLFPTTAAVHDYNALRLLSLQAPVASFESVHNCLRAQRADANQAYGLHRYLSLSEGARVMLRQNLWVQKGLVNGSIGTVHRIIYSDNPPPALPSVVVCVFPGYTGPPFIQGVPNSVPITCVQRTWQQNDTVLSRTGIPLVLSWAMTIHKCQGLTMPNAVIDIGPREQTTGLSFVAMSRVRSINNLVLAPFDFDRISRLSEAEGMRQRKDEEQRLAQL